MYAVGPFAFHRADFLNCLAKNLDQQITTVHFGKSLSSFATPAGKASPITLEFKDGSTSTCDILIGADGIHSATRQTMLELAAQDSEANGSATDDNRLTSIRNMKEPIWSGHTAYRTVANAGRLRNLNPNHRTLSTFQIVSSVLRSYIFAY